MKTKIHEYLLNLNNKVMNKTIMKYLAIVLVAMATVNCSKDDGVDVIPDPVQENPQPDPDPAQEDPQPDPVTTVSGIAPESAPKDGEVTITGTNFGADMSVVKVEVADKEATLISVSDTEVKFSVPAQAFDGGVKLTINQEEFDFENFSYTPTVQVSTINGLPLAASSKIQSVVKDSQGNFYVSDLNAHQIKKITPDGVVSIFAGTTAGFNDGDGDVAQFYSPKGLAIDSQGNIYVADSRNFKIRKIDTDGQVTTIAGDIKGDANGSVEEALFSNPVGIAIDVADNIYVTDNDVHKIKKIAFGSVSTFAGSSQGYVDGFEDAAKFSFPHQIHFGQDGALYVAEGGYKQGLSGVRKITAQGEVSTISGRVTEGHEDGSIDGALFRNPVGVATDALGHIYVADTGNYKIRKISPSGETITLAGSSFGYEDGEANEAKFSTSLGQLWVDENFNVYVADVNKVRMISQE